MSFKISYWEERSIYASNDMDLSHQGKEKDLFMVKAKKFFETNFFSTFGFHHHHLKHPSHSPIAAPVVRRDIHAAVAELTPTTPDQRVY